MRNRGFADTARLIVRGGKGGSGCCAFLPSSRFGLGSPCGGDGGRGGHVFLQIDPIKSSLSHLPRKAKAPNGGSGKGAGQHGKHGEDLVIYVPPGTRVTDVKTIDTTENELMLNEDENERIRRMYRLYPGWEDRGEIHAWEKHAKLLQKKLLRWKKLYAPMNTPLEQRLYTGLELDSVFEKESIMPYLVAKGGAGGRGNPHFATREIRSPRFCGIGQPGELILLKLELRLLAQVGLVGFPNAGKSTLLGALSKARPKVAAYPFTTLQPDLGVLCINNDEEMKITMADIPGLIAGAHLGRGLGHEFLRHVERSQILLHVVDLSVGYEEGNDQMLVSEFLAIRRELAAYKSGLTDRVRVIVANKIDLLPPDVVNKRLELLQTLLEDDEIPIIPISAQHSNNLDDLVDYLKFLLKPDSDSVDVISEDISNEVVKAFLHS